MRFPYRFAAILLVSFCILYLILVWSKQTPTFHVLIATGGRPSLKTMLDSLKPELSNGDAVTIVFDGPKARAKSTIESNWLEGFKCPVNLVDQVPNLGFWGHGIRNKYQQILTPQTTFVMHADDDDSYVPGSFNKLRKQCTNPDALYIAKMAGDDMKVIPSQNQEIKMSDIGTPCGIIPAHAAPKSTWEYRYGGDGEYYINLQPYVANTIFLDTLIYRIR